MARFSGFTALVVSFVLIKTCLGASINDEVVNEAPFEEKVDLPRVEEDKTWNCLSSLGQVSAVSVDGDGNLHILHRGNRVWDKNTFDDNANLRNKEQGPVPNDTIIIVDPISGKVLYSWGSNRFYMPHGLTVDRRGSSWVTDVGLHKVFKFSPRKHVLMMELGEAFKPGSDSRHFCKPTAVAVSESGYFYVSDGYCNSRILMFSQGGKMLKEIGAADGMVVPHSLVLMPEHGAICVADRENNRILCYSSGMDGTMPGLPMISVDGQGLGRVFAIDKRGSQLFAVMGSDISENVQYVTSRHGVIIDQGIPRALWGPDQGFKMAHSISISPDGKYLFVADAHPAAVKKVYKFSITE